MVVIGESGLVGVGEGGGEEGGGEGCLWLDCALWRRMALASWTLPSREYTCRSMGETRSRL